MIDDDERNDRGRPVIEAVLIAGLSALATGLANMVVDRFKKRRRRKPRKKPEAVG